MPDTNELIEEGLAAERLGLLDRAESCYSRAAESTDWCLQARALTKLADVHRARAQWDVALQHARRAQQIARESGRQLIHDEAVVAEGNVLMCRGDFTAAASLFESLLTTVRDPRLRGVVLQNLGSILAHRGQLGAAESAFKESHEFFRQAGYLRGEAIALNNCGRVALDQGDVERAEPSLMDAIFMAREVEDSELVALATLNLAEALAQRGENKRARDLASTAFGHFGSCGNRWRQVECLRLLGALHERERCLDDAERCYARALTLAELIDAQGEISTLRDSLAKLRAAHRDES